MLISAPKFKFMTAMHPAQRSRVVEGILIGVARPGNRIADGSVARHLNGGRAYGQVQAGLVLEAEAGWGSVIGVQAKKKFIPQVGEAEDADHAGRESVG